VVLHFRERFWERIRPQGDKDKSLARMSLGILRKQGAVAQIKKAGCVTVPAK
jgi:hypothetical protein